MNPLRLFDRQPGTRKDQDRMIRTVCQECPLRCGLIAYLKNGAVVDIHGDDDHPVNRGRLCARGLAFVQGLDSPDRLTRPALRKTLQEDFCAAEDWEKALDGLAEQLRKIKDQSGPESIAIGCDPETDLDFAIGAIHFAGLLGTPHIYQPVDFQTSRSDFLLPPHPAASCTTWGRSKTLFLIESDLASTHPVAFGWVLEAQQQGAKIIVADPRFTRTMSKADLALRIRPGTGNLLGLALMKMALEGEDRNEVAVGTRFTNPAKWKNSFGRLSWEELENRLGITAKEVKGIKDLFLKNNPVTFITGKTLATLPDYGIWSTLITAMGWSEGKAGGWYPLAGTLPPLLSNGTLQAPKASDMLSVRAFLFSGEGFCGMLSSFKGQGRGPDLSAWFGSFSRTLQNHAHMIFPAALWSEKSGVSFSLNRTLQWAEKIVEPREDCRSGLDFWTGLAKRFGFQDSFPWIREEGPADPRAFYQWVIANSPALSGCNPGQLQNTPEPYVQTENQGATAEPTAAPETLPPSSLSPDSDTFPLVFQQFPLVFRSGPASRYWPWTQKLEEEEAVQIHPETAGVLDMDNGETIIVAGPAGTREGRAWITRMVPKWMVASPGSSRGDRVLVHKMNRTPEESLTRLKEILP
jgi:anaerobic selenocysteine-containing dehydrogenase